MKKLIISGDDVRKFEGQAMSSSAPSFSPTERLLQSQREIAKFNHDNAIDEGFRNTKRDTLDDNGLPVTVLEARMGKMLNRQKVEKMLLSLNPNLIFQVSPADNKKVGIYVVDKTQKEGRRFLCGMENGWMPEFTVVQYRTERRIVKNDNHIPTWESVKEYVSERRGWRKVLVVLIKGGIINRTRAEEVFGLPAYDSRKWYEALNAD